MTEIINIKKISEYFQKQGFKIILEYLPREFTWRPDLYLRKGENFIACLVRESDTIPEVFIQRIAVMKPVKNKLDILIIFCKKPKQTSIQMISLYGIGIGYFHKNRLEIISKSKDFSKKEKPIPKKIIKKNKKMSRIDIFVSSHQIIPERKCVGDRIDEIRNCHRIPVFPILIEEDSRYSITQIRKCEIDNMACSELFVGILAEEYRSEVSFEIKRAFNKSFNVSDIFIFIKVFKNRPPRLDQLIDWIKKQNKVKYQEYTDLKDLKTKVMGTLMWKLRKMHKEKGIPFLE